MAAKGSKSEQKAKKQLVENEMSKLSAQLKAKHAKELPSLGYKNNEGKEMSDFDNLVMAIASISSDSSSKPSRINK